jgi:hypothetical protein
MLQNAVESKCSEKCLWLMNILQDKLKARISAGSLDLTDRFLSMINQRETSKAELLQQKIMHSSFNFSHKYNSKVLKFISKILK